MEKLNKQSNFISIFFVALTCVFAGGFIGAITNMINGAVGPNYFRIVMGWDFKGIWFASVSQGIFEGLLYGVIFSIIFTTGFGIITKGKANYIFALKQIFKIILFVFGCWIIGGILAVLLASISPEFYKSHYYNVPEEKIEMLKYAWVGGSIWGGMIGGFLSAILGVVLIKNKSYFYPWDCEGYFHNLTLAVWEPKFRNQLKRTKIYKYYFRPGYGSSKLLIEFFYGAENNDFIPDLIAVISELKPKIIDNFDFLMNDETLLNINSEMGEFTISKDIFGFVFIMAENNQECISKINSILEVTENFEKVVVNFEDYKLK